MATAEVIGIVITFSVLLVLVFLVFFFAFLTSRLNHYDREERLYQERQRQRERALTREEERLRLRQQLLKRAVERLVARDVACEGVPLATEVNGVEVLADYPLRSQRTRSPNGPGRPMVQLENGTAVTVTEFVAEVRANGRPAEALPGPTLLHMLHKINRQLKEQQQNEDGGERRISVVEVVYEQLQQLDQEEEKEAEEKQIAEREAIPDADEVYGKGLPYVLNPANAEIVYILDNPEENQEEEERDYQRHQERRSSMKTLEWILTPLLRRRSSASSDNPERSVD
ncbi:uncharacterized protein TM35_000262000 [Trypanosoma theileri]|uniref:Uncharacterized protein n=1 Tax=Trypanosoma theileri TaxID=67003 RepID=A0A1X0NQG1_9TRYP|nr:uncharacterized protein TM35_000262000 [Trypanosoma theileri]ORC86748.1 hypothetical protein TM35_000262000 [Trypanosoma theileri]